MPTTELPPLPAPHRHAGTYESAPFEFYTADQMREYALASLLQAAPTEPAAPAVQVQPSEPEYWQWRRKGEPWTLEKTFNSQVFATTSDSEVRPLYAAAQPEQPGGHVSRAVPSGSRYRHVCPSCGMTVFLSSPDVFI